MQAFQKILTILERAKCLGERILPNGTRLIGHVPHVAPEAWLHTIFPPLDISGIQKLEAEIKISIPADYKKFLMATNGLKIFSDRLSLDGLRMSYVRTGDEARQPYSLVTPNTFERPKDALSSYLYIGGYSQDGSHLYIDGETLKVFRAARRTSAPLNEWKNFGEMLVTETIRIALLFDEKGKLINPKEPTTPN